MEELKKLLSCHDWYYQYSDDFNELHSYVMNKAIEIIYKQNTIANG